jgi:hypothetical protein
MSELEDVQLAIDLRLCDLWAQLETDGLEADVRKILGDALRLGYAFGHRDGVAGLALPGTTERHSHNG